jgi:hypothetical protein
MFGLLPPPQVEIPPKLVALADEVIDETLITLLGGGARVARPAGSPSLSLEASPFSG